MSRDAAEAQNIHPAPGRGDGRDDGPPVGSREAEEHAGPMAALVERASDLVEPIKPKLRGWLHAAMVPASLTAGIVLISLAPTAQAAVACAVYSVTAWLLFATSAIYHRGTWGPRGEAILRRLDHANIFLIIAGTCTPWQYSSSRRTSGPCCCGSCGRAHWPASRSGSCGSAPRAGCTPRATWPWGGRRCATCPTSCTTAERPYSSWWWRRAPLQCGRGCLRPQTPRPLTAVVRLPRGVPRPDRGSLHGALHRHLPGRLLSTPAAGHATFWGAASLSAMVGRRLPVMAASLRGIPSVAPPPAPTSPTPHDRHAPDRLSPVSRAGQAPRPGYGGPSQVGN